jgi:hypothetical protein
MLEGQKPFPHGKKESIAAFADFLFSYAPLYVVIVYHLVSPARGFVISIFLDAFYTDGFLTAL